MDRRNFITNTTKAAGAGLLMSTPVAAFAMNNENITVGQVMDAFIKEVPNAPFEDTVDTLKSGSRDIVVTGIVTTMFATIDVIKKTIALGANFIIAHEPTFYNHADKTDWLENDDVYQYKAKLLKENNIAVWRNHDYIHSHIPDGVDEGVVKQLDWTGYYDSKTAIVTIPAITLQRLIADVKTKLGIKMLRYIGDLSQSCSRVLLLPGASGGTRHITSMSKEKPDLLICGEISEWETAEYVRDAEASGKKLSLILLGHIASEEPGSAYMVSWLKQKFPSLKAILVPSQNSLSFM